MLPEYEYEIFSSIGTFVDETAFKRQLMKEHLKGENPYKKVFEIENAMEPGMPDLLVISYDDTVVFVETKYAEKGIISFKKTQPPWYMRNKDLPIVIIAYNDLTKNIHVIDAIYLLKVMKGRKLKLRREEEI